MKIITNSLILLLITTLFNTAAYQLVEQTFIGSINQNSNDTRLQKVTYQFSNEPIDVVIPCVEKDAQILEFCIRGIRKYGKNINRIIVVSKNKLTDSAEWFCEDNFPFTFYDIAFHIFNKNEEKAREYLKEHSVGWVYQQLLKFYALYVIPNISQNVLVLDADVIFLNNVDFTAPSGRPYFSTGSEYHKPYFEHIRRLLPGLNRAYPQFSGICHHMLFQKPILDDLFALVSEYHRMPFWQALCSCIDKEYGSIAGVSEYEIYFNFACLRTDQVIIRNLKWANIFSPFNTNDYKDYHYIASHSYLTSLPYYLTSNFSLKMDQYQTDTFILSNETPQLHTLIVVDEKFCVQIISIPAYTFLRFKNDATISIKTVTLNNQTYRVVLSGYDTEIKAPILRITNCFSQSQN